MQKLNRAYQSLLGPLRLSMKDISTSLNTLVKSFHLSSTNVVLRPAELTLMAVVLLLMLSKMDSHLQDHLSTAAVTTYLSTILQQVGTNMDDVMLILTSLQY
ncbi:putative RNA polymerase II subunit B1 CTD phosphatase Rpap2 [Saccoglossus kowalevskii]|uniref:RNA polymerase II subunit B1 CTD phosphatase Rpap2-like n=1 Tax=Saccoglossus kowalevskii TaxID=10224 RepID=A0ABM0MN66_SACKO|nr:PREDICTED: putative RNA polymerase II subunit B1 CTD phosphatase Rpap2-like [Saccoglossus kowalevskii]